MVGPIYKNKSHLEKNPSSLEVIRQQIFQNDLDLMLLILSKSHPKMN